MRSAPAMPAPPQPGTPTPADAPAPVETVLMLLATAASHAGAPLSLTVSGCTRAIDVETTDAVYRAWQDHLASLSDDMRAAPVWFRHASEVERVDVMLHGWALRLRRINA